MTPEQFIAKWKPVELKERSASQAHFIDLCSMLGEPDPVSADPKGEAYAFERGAQKATGGDGWADVWKRHHFGWEYKGKKANLDAALKQLLLYAGALENPPLLVTSDMDRVRVTTNFQNFVSTNHILMLDEFADPAKLDLLRCVFREPERLKPGRTRSDATKDAAEAFAVLADQLAARAVPPADVARFIDRMVFCLFADDIGLLPMGLLDQMLDAAGKKPDSFPNLCGSLFDAMAKPGGDLVGFHHVDWFNGRLFDGTGSVPALTKQEIGALRDAAKLDWSHIDPAIFGTLFERFLNPEKRGQLGAFFTDPAQIMQLVGPVVVQPLVAEWLSARAFIEARLKTARGHKAAEERLAAFLERLRSVRVLDPACGSGNFLYLALHALKDLEKRVGVEAEALGLQRPLAFGVGPQNVRGIEKDRYAAELARIVIWIGEIQWMRRNGFSEARDPILKPLDNIECRDALLNLDGSEAVWPAAECIVGNPPFLGDKMMRSAMGDKAVEQLRGRFAGRVPGGADLVCYWFDKARTEVNDGRAKRVGLVATNSIRGGANRALLDRIVQDGQSIFEAWSDEAWVQDSAAVRVSLVCFGRAPSGTRRLDGHEVQSINSNLTGAGLDLTKARPLRQNSGVYSVGTQKNGPFEVSGEVARNWLQMPLNPNGRPNSDVVRPWLNGQQLTRRSEDIWIVDFGCNISEIEAALYELPFQHALTMVRPTRQGLKREAYVRYWWRHAEPRPTLRRLLSGVNRYLATPRVAKHRLFVWVPVQTLPDTRLFAIARDDDVSFGILHSRFHEAWSLRTCQWHGVGNDPQYNAESCFETFPFPDGLTPDVPAADYAADQRAVAIAHAAQRLNELRENWLNPPDLIQREPEVVPGFPDRILPKDDKAAKELAKRTLTNLYNAKPQWLRNAHDGLDAAVAAAYGWPATISEDDALANLLALNLARDPA